MKKNLRILLATLAVSSVQGYAADLKKPALQDVLKFQAFAPDDTVYIYNVGQKLFYGAGEAWDTQGTLTPTGLPAFFRADEKYPGTYAIWTEVPGKDDNSRWTFRQPNDGTAGVGVKTVFTDNNWDRNDARWVVKETKKGSKRYTISIPEDDADYVKGEVLGANLAHESAWAADNNGGVTYGIYYDIVLAETPDNGTWGFVPVDVIKAYNLKDDLGKTIEEAEMYGVDVVNAIGVYNSKDATLAQTQATIDFLKDAIDDNANPDDPVDRTDLIVNPRFDEGNKGWQITSTEYQLDGGDWTYNDGKLIQNGGGIFISTGGIVDKIYQVLNVRPGLYKVGLNVALAAAHENSYDNPDQFVYAETSYGIAQKARIDSVVGHYEVFAFVGKDGKLEIGFNEINPVCTHFVVDNATLTYYGNFLDAFIYASQEVGKKGDLVEKEDDYGLPNYTYSYKEALDDAVAAAEATTTPAAAVGEFKKVVKAYNDFEYSTELYARVKKAYDEADYYDKQLALDLSEFTDQLDEILGDATGTNEAISQLLDDIEAEEIKYIKENINPGTEYPFLTNNTFANGSTNGWNLSGGISAFKGGQTGVIESWSTEGGWDMNQKLTGVRPGVWRFEVRGFFRPDGIDETRNYWTQERGQNKGQNETRSKISINGKVGPFPAWISKGIPAAEYEELSTNGVLEDLRTKPGRNAEWEFWQTNVVTDFETNVEESRYYPDRLGSAAAYFDIAGHEDDYVASVSWIVGEDGNVDLHIFNDDYNNEQGAEWTVIKEVHLYYEGDDVKTEKEVLKDLIDKADEVLKSQFEAGEKNKLEAAKKAAETVWAKADKTAGLADQITKAYADLVAALEVTTIDEYEQLAAEVEATKLVRDQYEKTATDEALAAVDKLIASVEAGLAKGSYSAESALAEIPNLQKAAFDLKKPKGTASDKAPQDWTFMITNPKYLEGTTGWTIGNGGKVEVHAESNTGVAEIWNNDGTISQTVKGLPVGTYKVSVQGFYRQGDITKHVNTFKNELIDKYELKETLGLVADSIAGLEVDSISDAGVLYGNESGVVPVTIIYEPEGDDISIFQTATGSEGDWQKFDQDVLDQTKYGATWFFPSGLTAAASRFEIGLYDNYFYAQVVDDSDDDPADGLGNLELGLRTYWHHEGDWIPFTNWRLEYYGTKSAHAKEVNNYGATNSVDRVKSNAEVISTEYFSIDGRKQNSLQRGLNIVKVKTADGKTIIRKVLKK